MRTDDNEEDVSSQMEFELIARKQNGAREMIKTPKKSRIRDKTSLPDVRGMIHILKSLYGPSQLREIVAGLGLPAEKQACSGCNGSLNNGQEE
jgi:hypothetical protein